MGKRMLFHKATAPTLTYLKSMPFQEADQMLKKGRDQWRRWPESSYTNRRKWNTHCSRNIIASSLKPPISKRSSDWQLREEEGIDYKWPDEEGENPRSKLLLWAVEGTWEHWLEQLLQNQRGLCRSWASYLTAFPLCLLHCPPGHLSSLLARKKLGKGSG